MSGDVLYHNARLAGLVKGLMGWAIAGDTGLRVGNSLAKTSPLGDWSLRAVGECSVELGVPTKLYT